MRALAQRKDVIEEATHPPDHIGAARLVVAAARRPRTEHIGAVDRVIERSPAGVRRVQRVARVADGYDQLWPCDPGDLRVNPIGLDAEVRSDWDEILD